MKVMQPGMKHLVVLERNEKYEIKVLQRELHKKILKKKDDCGRIIWEQGKVENKGSTYRK